MILVQTEKCGCKTRKTLNFNFNPIKIEEYACTLHLAEKSRELNVPKGWRLVYPVKPSTSSV